VKASLDLLDEACRQAARRLSYVLGFGSTVVNIGARVSEVTDEYVLRVGANRAWHTAAMSSEEVEAFMEDGLDLFMMELGVVRLLEAAAAWHGGVAARNLAAAYRRQVFA
jgi:hypothetical protein